ncbi:MAG: hypothetical protein ACUZ8I_10395 [Candidatus Scalindua sp.]
MHPAWNLVYAGMVMLFVFGLLWRYHITLEYKDRIIMEERARHDAEMLQVYNDFANKWMSRDLGDLVINTDSAPLLEGDDEDGAEEEDGEDFSDDTILGLGPDIIRTDVYQNDYVRNNGENNNPKETPRKGAKES